MNVTSTGRQGPPPLIVVIARGVALVVVLPVRLLWELLAGTARWVDRWLLSPIGRAVRAWVLRPLAWLLHRLVWVPLAWLAKHLLWYPLVWFLRTLVRPVARVLVKVVDWLIRHVLVPLVELVRRAFGPALAAVGRGLWWLLRLVAGALAYAWRLTGRIVNVLYRLLLRPVGLALGWVWRHTAVPLGRALRAAWRVTVTPTVRWLRDAILTPIRQATRDLLTALGLRR
ncbi:hypothetical protein OOK41_25520 [Micromonospora sp. NBC_01655]|uniref:hypothetical protein n=1 Tax=unclassified Micromonospora TaxID=2617518 RepID=UPI000E451E72|nr:MULTISPECIES: hypothetical protein [unclassified Micromonospora]MCX4473625.1 hypothetical protein [Micromonospora sp. NBC_01655]